MTFEKSLSCDYIKSGMTVRVLTDQIVEGYIGEVQKTKHFETTRFYIWQNNHNGAVGNIAPATKGYKYSYVITKRNCKEIKFIELC